MMSSLMKWEVSSKKKMRKEHRKAVRAQRQKQKSLKNAKVQSQ